jgi:light-regulated signal transduction histidine kinase (bacteriophytochrome)
LVSTGQQQKYETCIIFPDGQSMDAVFHKSVFYDPDGQPGGIIGVYFDISERVKAENIIRKQVSELERINMELERFTYTVSHDLRSPLVTIKGFLGMLREDAMAGDHEQMEMDIQRISNATDKMHYLLEDLLQLSRIGRVGNPFTDFPMNEVVEELLEYLDGIIRENKCVIQVQPGMPSVHGDRARVLEVLQNLIENAIKFKKPEEELIIEIGCRDSEPVPVFYVQDNGMGVDPPFQKKIFGLFNKLDPRTSGTGIGLALVQRIIEFHGGRVWVESQGEGHGACFCFTMAGKP